MEREGEVEQALAAVAAWAQERPDIRGVGVVGSWARGTAGGDSDIDLMLLTDRLASYIEQDSWARQLGATRVVRTRRWGAVTERRLRLPSGLELDIAIAPVSWAKTDPLDAGTREVVRGGLRILHDPAGHLTHLLAASAQGAESSHDQPGP